VTGSRIWIKSTLTVYKGESRCKTHTLLRGEKGRQGKQNETGRKRELIIHLCRKVLRKGACIESVRRVLTEEEWELEA